MSAIVTLSIPMRIESVANEREHWRERRAREHDQCVAISAHMLRAVALDQLRLSAPPKRVTFVRVGKKQLDDDNLASAFKAHRDHVASMFRVDDGPKGPIAWAYDQRIGPAWAIEIRMEQ